MRLGLMLSCISASLCAGLTAAWVRSYFVPTESFEWVPYELPNRSRYINLRSGGGSVGVAYSNYSEILDPLPQTRPARRQQPGRSLFRYRRIAFDPPNQLDYIMFPDRWWSVIGFVYQRGVESGRAARLDPAEKRVYRLRYVPFKRSYLFVGMPYWLPVLLTGFLPARRLLRERRRRRRLRRGLCPRCGYDLRGSTGGVCPECGAPAPSPNPAGDE